MWQCFVFFLPYESVVLRNNKGIGGPRCCLILLRECTQCCSTVCLHVKYASCMVYLLNLPPVWTTVFCCFLLNGSMCFFSVRLLKWMYENPMNWIRKVNKGKRKENLFHELIWSLLPCKNHCCFKVSSFLKNPCITIQWVSTLCNGWLTNDTIVTLRVSQTDKNLYCLRIYI